MRTFQHPSNGEHAIAAGDAAEELLADGWAELDADPGAEAAESEPEIEPDIEPDPDPDPDASANGIPAPEKPLDEMKLPELIAYGEQIGIPAEQIDPFRKPGKSKAAAIELINAHIAAQPAE
jgi:hypothetical protein